MVFHTLRAILFITNIKNCNLGANMSNVIKNYLLPTKIIDSFGNIDNKNALLDNKRDQIFVSETNYCIVKGKGYIVLDFGKELCGGIRILNHDEDSKGTKQNIRVRFGESVNECFAERGEKNADNHHSIRDFTVELPRYSDQEFGQTGFRFVRIDFLENAEYRIVNIYAVSYHRDEIRLGNFKCDDDLVNKIYDTAAYTVSLNMQKYLWDGIKRDRLIWVGDMQPEVSAITYLYGKSDCVEETLKTAVDATSLPGWFGNIPSYSMWFIRIVYDYCLRNNDKQFAIQYLPYIEAVLEQMNGCVCDNGKIDYSLSNAFCPGDGFFFDWPSSKSIDKQIGNRYIIKYCLETLKSLYKFLGVKESPLCDMILSKLSMEKLNNPIMKQIVAMGHFSKDLNKDYVAEKLIDGGAKGLSTFMSYYILSAIAETSEVEIALNIMKEYYGGMLSVGATSFWEDFDVEWLKDSGTIDKLTVGSKKDIHGDFGDYCYKGFRHSLCHGWSCGPVQFLTEYILGVKISEYGYKKICIAPKMCHLKWAKGSVPTPYGVLEIEHKVNENGDILTTVNAPSEVEYEVLN